MHYNIQVLFETAAWRNKNMDKEFHSWSAQTAWLAQLVRLQQILSVKTLGKTPLANTPEFRSYLAARTSIEMLLENNPLECISLITITTNSQDALAANAGLAKIVGRRVKREASALVRFSHRSLDAFAHWHLITAHPWRVLRDDVRTITNLPVIWTMAKTGFAKRGSHILANERTVEANALLRGIRKDLRALHLGYRAELEPVVFPNNITDYLCRYLLGTARFGRFRLDRGLRLWAATKGARSGTCQQTVITPYSRMARLRNAAYCKLRGWRSMEEARKADARWQWRARDFLRGKKLRAYITEEDYVREWGVRWSPIASGVTIINQCAPGRAFPGCIYVFQERPTDAGELAELQREWEAALPVPIEDWMAC